jgi:hypothetical protein
LSHLTWNLPAAAFLPSTTQARTRLQSENVRCVISREANGLARGQVRLEWADQLATRVRWHKRCQVTARSRPHTAKTTESSMICRNTRTFLRQPPNLPAKTERHRCVGAILDWGQYSRTSATFQNRHNKHDIYNAKHTKSRATIKRKQGGTGQRAKVRNAT